MTYQQAGRIAILKRISGWVIFIPAIVSTLISILKFMYAHSEKRPGINAVMMDFVHVLVDAMRFNTPFLNFFWTHSPTPDFYHHLNVTFWLIYVLIFIALALQASGVRMASQAKFLRNEVQDRLILERTKGDEGLTKAQLDELIVVPRHSIFVQIFPLYILPVLLVLVGYFFFSFLGFL